MAANFFADGSCNMSSEELAKYAHSRRLPHYRSGKNAEKKQ
jgi:hypothetical protein